ncbi:CBS domain-containing protein [Candidatus Bathyarchaeota archaeon]|nr:CBS domain-containing protein [Candidatus Bathyarchaeota archaeon]
MALKVREVMTPRVVKVPEEETVKNAARKMAKFGISSLLVYGDAGLMAIITERDIIHGGSVLMGP